MGFAMRLVLGLVVFIASTSSLSNGEVYNVGDSDGWTSVSDHVDYKHWADTKQFHVGDIISKFLIHLMFDKICVHFIMQVYMLY